MMAKNAGPIVIETTSPRAIPFRKVYSSILSLF
jgi:hypothetical protein